MRESYGINESFDHLSDAASFLSEQAIRLAQEGYEMQQGSGIQFVDNVWVAGAGFSRDASQKEVADKFNKLREDLFDGAEAFVRESPDE